MSKPGRSRKLIAIVLPGIRCCCFWVRSSCRYRYEELSTRCYIENFGQVDEGFGLLPHLVPPRTSIPAWGLGLCMSDRHGKSSIYMFSAVTKAKRDPDNLSCYEVFLDYGPKTPSGFFLLLITSRRRVWVNATEVILRVAEKWFCKLSSGWRPK